MSHISIVGTGAFLPEKIMTNDELSKIVDTSDQWIQERTGIKRRHIAAEHETSSSMGKISAERAIAAAGLSANEIDLIIVATCTPDLAFPSTACLVQNALGITRDIPAFDISAACAGFIYALSVADSMLRTGVANSALVIGSEVLTRALDWKDRRTCVLFGDGAGAVVLQKSQQAGILSTHLHAQGEHKDRLYLPNLLASEVNYDKQRFLRMDGHEVFRLAVKVLGDVVNETLAANNMSKADIDWLVPHQANLRIIAATAKKLTMPMERVILTVGEHANTSAASIPLALDTGVRDGRIKTGDLVLMEAIGGGLAWGSVLVRM